MGADEREERTQLSGQPPAESGPREPEEIRRDIEETREQLGDTVAAVAQKTDVKAQAQAKVDDVKARVAGKKDEFTSKVQDAAPEGSGEAAQQAKVAAQENRIPLAIAGAALAGFVLGRITAR